MEYSYSFPKFDSSRAHDQNVNREGFERARTQGVLTRRRRRDCAIIIRNGEGVGGGGGGGSKTRRGAQCKLTALGGGG